MAIELIPMYQIRGSAVTYQPALPRHSRRAGQPSLRSTDRRLAAAVHWRTNMSRALLVVTRARSKALRPSS
jgi:hypothetical protein